jgi:hypothetical protein
MRQCFGVGTSYGSWLGLTPLLRGGMPHFPLNQDEFAASVLSFGNASSSHLTSQAETKALNPHHHSWSPSSDRPTPTLHCYKKIISTMITLPTTQSHLYFASSLTRAPHHQSSTRRCHSLLSLSHAHRPSTQ